jgi:hypothetical protein
MDISRDIHRRMRRNRRIFRFLGFLFTLTGGAIVVSGVALLIDPSSTMTCNGQVTTSIGCKASSASFGLFMLTTGLFFLFVKARVLDRIFIWRQSIRSLFTRKHGT